MNAEPIEEERAEEPPAAKAPKPRATRRSSTAPVADLTTELPSTASTTDADRIEAPAAGPVAPAGEPRADRAAPLRAIDPRPNPVPTNVYRARRPAVAFLLIIPALAVGLLFVRGLAMAAFGQQGFQLDGVIASVCGLVSLPLMVAGLYGLVTGAAHGAEHYGFRIWARPPLAYLLVGLVLALTAGIAVR